MAASPSERVAPKYFSLLNYSLANEDTAFELSLLPEPVDHIVAIAGSGSRVLPLVGRARRRVTCIDVAAPQLFLTEMRVAATRAFDLEGYRAFLGYPPSPASPAERKKMFRALALSSAAREHWSEFFTRENWRSPLYDGKWERTFTKLSRVNRALTGKGGAGLFETTTLEAQRAYVATTFPRGRFRWVIQVVGNAAVFNTLLYRGSFPRKNSPGTHFELYEAVFERLFARTLARESFFLQLAFFGEVRFPEGCPVEAQPEPFARAKEALRDVVVDYRLGDAIAVAGNLALPIDFFSISDVPSYFSGTREQAFLQELRPALSATGRIVVRTYLHAPVGVDVRGYVREDPKSFENAALDEKVGVYGFDVYRRDARDV